MAVTQTPGEPGLMELNSEVLFRLRIAREFNEEGGIF